MHSPAEAEARLVGAEQALQVQRDESKALIASNEMAERAAVALRNEAANATAQVRAARAELEAYRVRAASAEAELEAYRVRAPSDEAELEAYRVRVASAEAELEAYRVRLHLVHGSTSWRLTRPLRATGRKFFRRP
jgi:chromosome segregation ATPase